MTTTDPTTILREAIKAVVIESEADDVLATRIPQACPTCKGDAKVTEPMGPMLRGMMCNNHLAKPTPCPDCPTIGTLLLWGWNVATYQEDGPKTQRGYTGEEWHAFYGRTELLAALREVPT